MKFRLGGVVESALNPAATAAALITPNGETTIQCEDAVTIFSQGKIVDETLRLFTGEFIPSFVGHSLHAERCSCAVHPKRDRAAGEPQSAEDVSCPTMDQSSLLVYRAR